MNSLPLTKHTHSENDRKSLARYSSSNSKFERNLCSAGSTPGNSHGLSPEFCLEEVTLAAEAVLCGNEGGGIRYLTISLYKGRPDHMGFERMYVCGGGETPCEGCSLGEEMGEVEGGGEGGEEG
jgi:hypothetical protein